MSRGARAVPVKISLPFRGEAGKLSVYVESDLCWCPQRHLEAQRIRNYFRLNGAELSASPSAAGLVVLNTCALLQNLEERALERIAELRKIPGELLVTGCLKKINGKALAAAFGGTALAPRELHKLDALFPGFAVKFRDVPEVCAWPGAEVPEYFSAGRGSDLAGRGHWFVQASSGCEARRRCSYCAVWKSTGPYRSRPLADCLEEARLGAGRPTLHLLDSGAYGTDIGLTFPVLLEGVLGVSGRSRLFVECLNPMWALKYLPDLERLVRGGRVAAIRFAHQSGSDRILRLMNRPYSSAQGLACVEALRKACPRMKLMTQFIVGFPGETERDFALTLDLLRRGRFDGVEAFAYSPRPGTPACSLPGRVPQAEAERRLALLRHLAASPGLGGGR
jgi:MiaB/RimO family radical SAM methylthiotransferase